MTTVGKPDQQAATPARGAPDTTPPAAPPAATGGVRPALPLVPAGAELAPLRLAPGWAVACFAVAFLLYLALLPHFLLYSSPPTGDQPFYLMDTISLVQDGDLELSNNYANHDYDKFYKLAPHPPGFVGMDAFYPLPEQFAETPARPPTERYAFHLPGLGVLLAPAWVVGGWFGLWWPATLVVMGVLGALLATNVFLLAYEVTGRRGIALAVWLPIAFSNPIMSYSFLIFTELPVGLLLIYAWRRLARGWAANGPGHLALVGLCIGYIPWLAWRCALIAGPLAVYALIQWGRYRRALSQTQQAGPPAAAPAPGNRGRAWTLAACLLPVLGSALLLGSYHLFLFGKLLPAVTVPELGNQSPFHWPWNGGADLAAFARTGFALLFDRQMGLLIFAPIYLLAAVGSIALWRSARTADRRLLAVLVLTGGPYLGLLAAFTLWNGLWCPPARYLTTLVPLLAAPLAFSLAALGGSRLYRLLYGLFALPGFAFMAIFMADPRMLWPNVQMLTWLAESPQAPWHLDLRGVVPAFPPQLSVADELRLPAQLAGIVASALLVVLVGYLLLHRSPLIARAGRRRYAIHALTWLVVLTVLASGWYAAAAPYLKHRTLLVHQHTWKLEPPVADPHGIAYLDGKIYVTDFRGGAVGVLDLQTGAYRPFPARATAGPLPYTHPGDIKAGPDGLLYVLNNGEATQALFVLRPDGQVVRQAALVKKNPIGQGLGIGPDGSLYTTDMGQMLKYGPDGGDPRGRAGGQTGGFNNVMGVAAGNDGLVYVAESSGQRVQVLDAQGRFVRSYPLDCSPFYPAVQGEWVDVSCSRGLVSINTRTGEVQHAMAPNNDFPATPAGIAYGSDGTLYILDFGILVACTVQH
jgi:streptogramin lyase